MQPLFPDRPLKYLGSLAALSIAMATSSPHVVFAEDEVAETIDVVAAADDVLAGESPKEWEKDAIRGHIRRVIDSNVVVAEEEIEKAIVPGNAFFFESRFGGGDEMGKYWIGVECREASPDLRAQLGLDDKQGLVVVRVSDDSAAKKAGLKAHDVVVAVGDNKLAHVPDLAKAVNSAEGKQVTLKIIRAGKEQSVEVTPAERPRDVVKFIARPHAGMFVGTSGNVGRFALPENMTIKIERQGKKPAQIEVRRGEEKWEVTEEQLDKLPNDVRPLVQRSMGNAWTMALPAQPPATMGIATPPMMQIEALPEAGATPGRRVRIKTIVPSDGHGDNTPVPSHDHREAVPVPPGAGGGRIHVVPLPPSANPGEATPDIMKRLEMLDRRLEQMQDEIRRLRNERQGAVRIERRVVPQGGKGDRLEGEHHEVEIEIDDRPAPQPNR